MKLNFVLICFCCAPLLILTCSRDKGPGENKDTGEAPSLDTTQQIMVSRDQFTRAGMELGGIQQYDYAESIAANGFVDVPPDYRARIGTFMGGYVKSAALLPGDHVRKGQVLVILENIDYLKLQQDFLAAKEQLGYLKSVYESQKVLADERISAQRSYQQAKSDYSSMLAAYNSLSKQLQLLQIDPVSVSAETMVSTIRLTAPIEGYITKAHAINGMFVNPSDVLYEIIDPSHMHIELKVFEKDLHKIRKGQPIVFRVPEVANKSGRGEVILIGSEIGGEDRTVSVHGHINDQSGLKLTPGMYIEASIKTNRDTRAGLPAEALVTEQGKDYIYIKESERGDKYYFKRIAIRVVTSNDQWFEVQDSSGLLQKAENNILIKGTYYLTQE